MYLANSNNIVDKLPPCYEPLKSMCKLTLESQNDYDFLSRLCEGIVPIAATIPLIEGLRTEWATSYSEYSEGLSKAKKAAKREIRNAYDYIACRITENGIDLLKHESALLLSVRKLLEDEEPYCSPPEYQLANDQLCSFCTMLLTRGEERPIPRKIIKSKQVIYPNGKDANLEELNYNIHISSHLDEVKRSELLWFSNIAEDPWLCWMQLQMAQIAWNANIKHYRTKKIDYSTSVKRASAMSLHCEVDLIQEIQVIKQRLPQGRRPQYYFTQTRYRRFLEVILRAITTKLVGDYPQIYTEGSMRIVSLELMVYSEELWVFVEWDRDKKERFCLHKYQENSAPLQFFQKTLKTPPNTVVKVNKGTIADHCYKSKLTGVLKDLFFSNCTKTQGLFHGMKIENVTLHNNDFDKLLAHLQQCQQNAGNPQIF